MVVCANAIANATHHQKHRALFHTRNARVCLSGEGYNGEILNKVASAMDMTRHADPGPQNALNDI